MLPTHSSTDIFTDEATDLARHRRGRGAGRTGGRPPDEVRRAFDAKERHYSVGPASMTAMLAN